MAKKIVICCDGTWNAPRDETNITRTYRFLVIDSAFPRSLRAKTASSPVGATPGTDPPSPCFTTRVSGRTGSTA